MLSLGRSGQSGTVRTRGRQVPFSSHILSLNRLVRRLDAPPHQEVGNRLEGWDARFIATRSFGHKTNLQMVSIQKQAVQHLEASWRVGFTIIATNLARNKPRREPRNLDPSAAWVPMLQQSTGVAIQLERP